MATSLSGKSIGAPDNAFAWYLQSGGGSLASGFPVALGDGTETPLWLDENGIGEVDPGGFIRRSTEKTLASDVTNSTTSATAVTGLTLPVKADALYEIEAILLCKSAATTTGVQVQLTGPSAQTEFVCYDVLMPSTTTLVSTNSLRQYYTDFGQVMANGVAPAANALFPIFLKGLLKTTSTTPASDIGFSVQSEVASSTVTVATGSILRLKRIG